MLIRNKNISVSQVHNYTKEKVIKAKEFIAQTNRMTPLKDWVDMYNYLKGTNEKIVGCRSCASAKFINGVKNYAKYGELVLLNMGISLEKPNEEETPSTEEKPIQQLSAEIDERPKRGRKKKITE